VWAFDLFVVGPRKDHSGTIQAFRESGAVRPLGPRRTAKEISHAVDRFRRLIDLDFWNWINLGRHSIILYIIARLLDVMQNVHVM